ncbi:MAG TPA: flagellar biosynthesis protein FlhF [Gammaproteobacteria bacterium]|nr:flagellar biosynthesis protein FlhF [Gammaproteobacteria bacterium]
MNIKRFVAPDMRRAIQQVRSEHGPDAVILSSRSLDDGVEIIAAVDYDETLLAGVAPAAAVAAPAPESEPSGGDQRPHPSGGADDCPRLSIGGDARPQSSRELAAMQAELRILRSMLREHCLRLSWADMRAFDPERAALKRRIEALELAPSLVDTLVAEVEHADEPERAWRDVMFGLGRRIQLLKEDPLEQGGVFALVGPTGVGKTTTIAKLAARHCLRYGRDSLALVTIDNFRVGAHRQLDAFGAILGVPVRRADTAEDLDAALAAARGRRLVLVDTAGMAPRDPRLKGAIEQLERAGELARFLALAANMQRGVMAEAVRAFGAGRLSGVVLTKLDEAEGLGAALSVLIESGLPAAWLSEGQRVPEDLKLARIAYLLGWAAGRGGANDASDANANNDAHPEDRSRRAAPAAPPDAAHLRAQRATRRVFDAVV